MSSAERVAAQDSVPSVCISFAASLNFAKMAFGMWGTESAGRWPKRLALLREDLDHFILSERRAPVKIKMSKTILVSTR